MCLAFAAVLMTLGICWGAAGGVRRRGRSPGPGSGRNCGAGRAAAVLVMANQHSGRAGLPALSERAAGAPPPRRALVPPNFSTIAHLSKRLWE